MLRIGNIRLTILEAENEKKEKAALREKLLRKLKIKETEIKQIRIFKKSVDARKKDMIYFVYTLDFEAIYPERLLKKFRVLSTTPDLSYQPVETGDRKLVNRPVIIGTGPSGLFAGLLLSEYGYKPILLEKGDDVDTRAQKIESFWSEAELDVLSNVQFGEGGAGTFSDGKLTTLIGDQRCRTVLEAFIEAGAPEEILYRNKPHIGTDLLREVVKRIRMRIIENGGEVRFRSEVTDFILNEGQIKGLVINRRENILSETVLMGIGHSSRDTYEWLYESGVEMTPKSFSIGVRIEHPQKIIDESQYGKWAKHPALGAAEYKLSYHGQNNRSAYTFCMCPGGMVVAAASEKNRVVTNGMSEHNRNQKNANAALLVGVNPSDFGCDHPLAGIDFQRRWESAAFEAGGKTYLAPAQRVGDFLADLSSKAFGEVTPSYRPGVVPGELKDCLPDYVIETMKDALKAFDKKIKGFSMDDAVMTGVETRSSAPLRIIRNELYESNIKGLYPMGEGAGYAGGIMSSAVDGIKTAEMVMMKFKPIDTD